MSNNKQTGINLITSLLAFVINAGINLFLTPYLISQLGTEAYGFIGLANDFVGYATILSMALNTMSSRFIAVAYHKGDKEKASAYINSVFAANIILGAVVVFAGVFIVWKLEYIINIPAYLMTDVKITFGMVFVNYLLSIIISVLNCAPFIKNKMNHVYIRNMISYILKLIITIALLAILDVRIYLISLVTIICTVYLAIANAFIFKRLLPEFNISLKGFSIKMIKEILSSGVWMSLLSLSNLLLSGLNSLLTNRFISPIANGYLSVSKTIPNYISQLGQQLGTVFAPSFTRLYSEGKIDELVEEVKKSVKIMSFIMIVPIAGFIAFGTEFYTLWLKDYSEMEIKSIQELSVIITLPYLFNAFTYPIVQINSALNKVRIPVIFTFFVGIANILIVLPLGITNHLTLNLLTIFSSVFLSIKLIIFTPIYASKILHKKITIFYPSLIHCYIVFMVILGVFAGIRSMLTITSWVPFIITIAACAVLGYTITFFILLSKEEHKNIIEKVKAKLNHS